MKQLLSLVFFLAFIFDSAKGQTPAASIPDVSLSTLAGKPFLTKNIVAGKKSLFVFFDANCDHCQRAVSTISSRYTDLKAINLYLVTLDSKPVLQSFMSSYGKNLQNKKNVMLLQDLKYQFIPHFKPKKYPGIFLYSPQKKLVLYTNDEREVDKVISAAK